MRIKRIELGIHTLATNVDTGDGTFGAVQIPIRAGGFKNVRMGWDVLNESVANMITRPGYQVANVENSWDAAVTLGSDTQTGTGYKFPSALTDISASTAGKQLLRAGIWAKNPSGTQTLQVLGVRVWLEYEDC